MSVIGAQQGAKNYGKISVSIVEDQSLLSCIKKLVSSIKLYGLGRDLRINENNDEWWSAVVFLLFARVYSCWERDVNTFVYMWSTQALCVQVV